MKELLNLERIIPEGNIVNGIEYICPTVEQEKQVFSNLVKKMLDDDKDYDVLIPMANGAYTWARKLSDRLGKLDDEGHFKPLKIFPFRASSYVEIGKKGDPKKDEEMPFSLPKWVKSAVVLDDVADSGETIEYVKEILDALGVEKITVATLFYKERSIVVPDYYGEKTDAWINFEHETFESICLIGNKLLKQGVPNGEIRQNLLEVGFEKEDLDIFIPRAGFEIK